MADQVLSGKQVANISEMTKNSLRGLGRELSGKTDDSGKRLILDHIFAFVGLAGGVGTSTLVANLAAQLVKNNRTVLVIDLNILYPIQHSLFKIKQEVETKDLFSYLTGECPLGEGIKYPMGRDIGVFVANNRGLVDLLDSDTKDAATALTECLERVSSLFDFVLIDCSNNLENELVNAALYKADRIMAVMDENIECLSNYNRMVGAMAACGIDYMRVKTIMNKRTSIQYSKSVFSDFNIDLVSVLPFELGIIESGLKGEIFSVKADTTSRNAAIFCQKLKEIAKSMERLSGSTEEDIED